MYIYIYIKYLQFGGVVHVIGVREGRKGREGKGGGGGRGEGRGVVVVGSMEGGLVVVAVAARVASQQR